MSDTDVSYFIKILNILKRMEKKSGAYCFDCLREIKYSLILEGELCLAIRDNRPFVVMSQYFHWMCVPNATLKEVLKLTTKQAIMDDTQLNEECRTRVLRAIDNKKIDETQYNDDDFVFHHQRTLRYVNSLRLHLKIKYGIKPKTKRGKENTVDKDLSKDIKKLDINE